MAGVDAEEVVFIGEYCGGGFGSKIAGSPIMAVPAVLSRKIGRPVMLRITRYEENYIGRGTRGPGQPPDLARPGSPAEAA